MSNKIRILYIVPSLRLCNGIASYAMNYFRNIDPKRFQIDFITGIDERSIYYDEIENAGSKIYYIPKMSAKNINKTRKKIKNFFKENSKNYDIIHCHVLNMGAFYLYYAKKYGIKVRILHSHEIKTSDLKLHELRNKILLPVAIKNANYFCACSYKAGNKILVNKEFKIINNAINGERFKYNDLYRKEIRKKYNISDNTIVIGNVGRLCKQKNQRFLMDIYSEIKLQNDNTKLMIVGNGPLENKLKEYAKIKKIDENVIFVETTYEIEKMYQAFDVFVLPSISEGLGIVLIEAQVSGLPCVVSDTIPKEAQISSQYKKISLQDSISKWGKVILNSVKKERETNLIGLETNNFNVKEEANKLGEYYLKIFKENDGMVRK